MSVQTVEATASQSKLDAVFKSMKGFFLRIQNRLDHAGLGQKHEITTESLSAQILILLK